MWTAFRNFKSDTVHAISFPAGMSPHGFAMYWPLEETSEKIPCHLCLKFALRWHEQDEGLAGLLPPHLKEARHFAA
jgi:hypothetical protein